MTSHCKVSSSKKCSTNQLPTKWMQLIFMTRTALPISSTKRTKWPMKSKQMKSISNGTKTWFFKSSKLDARPYFSPKLEFSSWLFFKSSARNWKGSVMNYKSSQAQTILKRLKNFWIATDTTRKYCNISTKFKHQTLRTRKRYTFGGKSESKLKFSTSMKFTGPRRKSSKSRNRSRTRTASWSQAFLELERQHFSSKWPVSNWEK